jgi:hypothetical protein
MLIWDSIIYFIHSLISITLKFHLLTVEIRELWSVLDMRHEVESMPSIER